MKSINIYLLFALSLGVILTLIVGAGFLFSERRPISLSAEDHYVSVLGSKIRYRIHENENKNENERPVILLLHGFGGSLHYWSEIQPMLSHNKSIAIDLVGFGGSDKPPISYDLDTQWRYLHAFMTELNIQNIVIVGISMGGSLSAWTAAKSKDRVVGLIMIAPSGFSGSLYKNWPINWFYRPGIPNRIAWVIVNNPLYRWLFPNSLAAQALSVTNSYNSQFDEALKNINQPALLAWSQGDTTSLFRYRSEYKQRITNLELLELPASLDHSVLERFPQGTASFINKFVDKLSLKQN